MYLYPQADMCTSNTSLIYVSLSLTHNVYLHHVYNFPHLVLYTSVLSRPVNLYPKPPCVPLAPPWFKYHCLQPTLCTYDLATPCVPLSHLVMCTSVPPRPV